MLLCGWVLIDWVARPQLHTNLCQWRRSPGVPRCPPRNFYFRFWESNVCPAGGRRMWTKLLPEAGRCNLMFLPKAAGGGQNFCRRLGSSMARAPLTQKQKKKTPKCFFGRLWRQPATPQRSYPHGGRGRGGGGRTPIPPEFRKSPPIPRRRRVGQGLSTALRPPNGPSICSPRRRRWWTPSGPMTQRP